MDPQIKHFIIMLVSAIIFIGIAWIGYSLLLHTPLGKGLNAFLGGAGAVLGAAGAQLSTCAKHGFFNVNKGCWLGVAGIGIGIVYAGANIAMFFKESINKRLSRVSQLKGQSDRESINDLVDELNVDEINEVLADSEVAEESVFKILNKALTRLVKKISKKLSKTPEEFQQDVEMAEREQQAANEEIDEQMNSEEQDEANDNADNTEFYVDE